MFKKFDKQHLNEIFAVWYDFTIYKTLYNPFGCNNKHVLLPCIFNNCRWRGRISNDNVNFLQTSVKFPLSSDRYRRSYSKQNWFPILPEIFVRCCDKDMETFEEFSAVAFGLQMFDISVLVTAKTNLERIILPGIGKLKY